jgi:hypothetical protein
MGVVVPVVARRVVVPSAQTQEIAEVKPQLLVKVIGMETLATLPAVAVSEGHLRVPLNTRWAVIPATPPERLSVERQPLRVTSRNQTRAVSGLIPTLTLLTIMG